MKVKRFAAHYVWCVTQHRMHYIELTDDDRWIGHFPLECEQANTTFVDGVLIPIPAQYAELSAEEIVRGWQSFTAELRSGMPVKIVHARLAELSSSAKLRTDNSSGDRHVK